MYTSPPCSGHHVVSQPYIIFTASAPPSRPYGRAATAPSRAPFQSHCHRRSWRSPRRPCRAWRLSQVKWMALTSSAAMAMGRSATHMVARWASGTPTFRMAHLGVRLYIGLYCWHYLGVVALTLEVTMPRASSG